MLLTLYYYYFSNGVDVKSISFGNCYHESKESTPEELQLVEKLILGRILRNKATIVKFIDPQYIYL